MCIPVTAVFKVIGARRQIRAGSATGVETREEWFRANRFLDMIFPEELGKKPLWSTPHYVAPRHHRTL